MNLDQLLDETGANRLGGRHTKKASAQEKPDFSKLAERCRRALTATPDEQVEATEQQLAEKTAAVAIIHRTMTEIAELDSGTTKTAAARAELGPDHAVFIKAALEAGHTPEQIAEFLEKQAGRFGRFIGELGAGLRSGRAKSLSRKADDISEGAVRSWQGAARKYEHLGDAEKAKFVEKLRVKYNDETAAEILKGQKGFQHLPAYKAIQPKAAPVAAGGGAGGAGKALSVNIGGSNVGVTAEQLAKVKKPAMYLGAGMLAHRAVTGGRSEPEKKKSGVVVVNS